MNEEGKINRIVIEGFKSIKSLDLTLSNINILIGSNGSGKSNFIGVFKFLNHLVLRDLQSYIAKSGGANTFLHFGVKNTPQLKLHIDFSPNSYECVLVPTTRDSFVFNKEICQFHGDKIGYTGGTKTSTLANNGDEETALPRNATTATIAGHVTGYLKSWKVYHFHDTSDTAKVKLTGKMNDNIRLRQDAGNLAAMLYLFQQKYEKIYDEILFTVQLVAPFVHDFILQPDKEENIRLKWKHRGTDAYFDANDFSDGTLRFICLATLLLQPLEYLPQTILLDEPELGLHPHAIVVLSDIMKSAATKAQIIASSQSLPLVNQFTAEDIIVVDRKDESSVFRRISSDEIEDWMEEFGMGDIWEKNIFGGNPQ